MVAFPDPAHSPFRQRGEALPNGKFQDPKRTREGEPRATVPLAALDTLWINTGTLCNLACATCYIESSPTNDALVYITTAEVLAYLDEIEADKLGTRTIAFTGGEPFMNRDFIPILEVCLSRGFNVLILTNAMRPMRRFEDRLAELIHSYKDQLTFRVSLDHYTQTAHEAERGENTWDIAVDGLIWLQGQGAGLAVAGRQLADEDQAIAQAGYADLFAHLSLPLDVNDPEHLVLFPEMDSSLDTPEITENCWDILHLQKSSVMCSSSRMVVRRKGEATPRVAACTLLPYDPQFDLGSTLKEASQTVRLNHPHCSRFCVLGGASCSA